MEVSDSFPYGAICTSTGLLFLAVEIISPNDPYLEAFHILENSKVSWTLLCPPYMPEGAMTGQYRLATDYGPEGGVQISTGDAAHFILDELEHSAFVARRVGIAY